ncbi:MAG: replication protein RepA, partial [Acidobacteria bacterium]|nr:replication protein RepA [Acidobacteriota bacterium]
MPPRLTAPPPPRSVRGAAPARPGQTWSRLSDVLATPLPGLDPGSPPAPPGAARPAPRAGHWTRDDQIDGLIRVADREPEVGFMVRLLALCTLPRTDPGTLTHYVRRNGRYALVVIAGGPEPRLPFGVLPRLLLAWICTEAVRTRSRRLVLGRSVAEFMRRLGVQSSDSAGRYGIRTRLREQMTRLFRASIELTQDLPDGVHTVADRVTTDMRLWWKPRRSDEAVRWDSAIVLGHDFFNEILAAPVPIDMQVLRELTRSSLGLDLYLWLTYRLFRLDRPLSHVAAGVPAVRLSPGAGARPVRQGLPPGRAARAREDPYRLAPALVLDAEGAARAAP